MPLLPFPVLLGALTSGLLLVIVTALLAGYYARATGAPPSAPASLSIQAPTSTGAPPSTIPPTDLPGLGAITFDASGQYAFPIAADPALFTWTHVHWDDTLAADLEMRRDLTFPEFVAVSNAQLVAVTAGTVEEYSGSRGGLGYMLHGDDGRDYYYAHMSDQWAPDGARVAAGQPLGVMGNTGGTAQFIEPHLHLAIGPRDTLWTEEPRVNAAEWLKATFGLDWAVREAAFPEPDLPAGPPVDHPDLAIVTPFKDAVASGLPEAAVELGFPGGTPGGPYEIHAPLGGVVNVIRWTAHYGTRIQINNPATDSTVVISGVDAWSVWDGDVVRRGDVLGTWNPAHRSRLHYLMYRAGAIADPTASLGLPVVGHAEAPPGA